MSVFEREDTAAKVWPENGTGAVRAGHKDLTVAAQNLRLLASLNHEIRTPLSGILGMTDLLLETGLSDEQKEYVSAARGCAETLFDLLNATLEYSSLQAGCIRVETTEFRPADLLDGVLNEARVRADARGMEMRTRLSDELGRVFTADAHRVRQVMMQVLNSLIRYGGSDWIEVEAYIEPEAEANGPELAFIVSCESMAPYAGGVTSGAGLAHAVVDGLVKLLGGWVEQQFDEATGGYRLSVHLPLGKSQSRGPLLTSKDAGRRSLPPRILVVDDNRISQQVIGALLAKGGWQFDTASDGMAALDAASKTAYQLVLMDLQMPGMDGLETTAKLRQIEGYAGTPVLALTADVSDLVRGKCRDAGMNAFIEKPIHAAELNAVLYQFLNSSDGD